jgi:hypothetical protein
MRMEACGNSHVHMTSMAIDTCGAQEPVRFRSMIELTIVYCLELRWFLARKR